jgi:nucleoside-diphosphate-sugar epimerase
MTIAFPLPPARMNSTLPPIRDVEVLEDVLSRPSEGLVNVFRGLTGDILILGAGGKMGPSTARMARRASDAAGIDRRVIAASRFSDAAVRDQLDAYGIQTCAGDLLCRDFVQSLPDAENVVFLVGRKFGVSDDQSRTWATNTYAPALVCEKFLSSRFVALSSGNIYPYVPVDSLGSTESDAPEPVGEYGMSALGRERIITYFSQERGLRSAIIRLNYATELRYGVLVDLAQRVNQDREIVLDSGYVNVIWQADACDFTLRCLQHVSGPPFILNVTGLERLSCRGIAEHLGNLLGKRPKFVGTEGSTALLSDARRAAELFGPPTASYDAMITTTAAWIRAGGTTWNKPTHFERRNGQF